MGRTLKYVIKSIRTRVRQHNHIKANQPSDALGCTSLDLSVDSAYRSTHTTTPAKSVIERETVPRV